MDQQENKLTSFEEGIARSIAAIESRLQEVENYRNPRTMEGRLENAFFQIEQLTDSLAKITQKLASMNLDERYVELFRDEELKELYLKSGLTVRDVKKFMEKFSADGKEVSDATISRYVNGQVENLMLRSTLGKYFRENAIKLESKDGDAKTSAN